MEVEGIKAARKAVGVGAMLMVVSVEGATVIVVVMAGTAGCDEVNIGGFR